jgi:catechol 2,3-dioxygenase-like lactoylglutathione lyase family enzyme
LIREIGAPSAGAPPAAQLMLPPPRRYRREQSMIAHTSLPVSDYSRAKAFYLKVLKPLGYTNNLEYGESAGFNDGKNTDFWITEEETIVPLHLAFEAKDRGQVEAFYAAALAAGAKDNGKPGYRDYWPGYYAAFVYDADGHNIEAVWYDYSKASR